MVDMKNARGGMIEQIEGLAKAEELKTRLELLYDVALNASSVLKFL